MYRALSGGELKNSSGKGAHPDPGFKSHPGQGGFLSYL